MGIAGAPVQGSRSWRRGRWRMPSSGSRTVPAPSRRGSSRCGRSNAAA